jgi:hypothetical protein
MEAPKEKLSKEEKAAKKEAKAAKRAEKEKKRANIEDAAAGDIIPKKQKSGHAERAAATEAFLMAREEAREAAEEARRAKKEQAALEQKKKPHPSTRRRDSSSSSWSSQQPNGDNSLPGDWSCPACSAHCFASKLTCFKCGADRSGKGGDGKHRRREELYQLTTSDKAADQTLTCKDCSSEFLFTAGEQEFFQRKGFANCVRARCADCTKKKKDAFGGRYGQGGDGSGIKPTSGGRLVCFDFQKGECSRANCKFAHGEADGALETVQGDGGASGGGAGSSGGAPPSEAEIRCYNCSAFGHRSRDCPEPQRDQTCYACGQSGHVSRECPKIKAFSTESGGAACFHCGTVGHLSRNCPEGRAGACFNCGKTGHMAKDCREPPKGLL